MNVTVHPVRAPFKYAKGTPALTVIGGATDSFDRLPALYRSSVPSHDEGWTRWILDNRSIPYRTVGDKEMRNGIFYYKPSAGVTIKHSVIVIPDQPARTLLDGYRAGTMPPEISGGIGEQGVRMLRQFIESGGTVVFLNRASNFAIEQFKLPVRNVVAGLPRTEFYVPGSILRIELNTEHPLVSGSGMPKETIAWAEDSPVFEVADMPGASVPAANVSIIASYPADANPLLSGRLLGDEKIRGKAALVEVKMGEGHVILFGFRPQYRAQSLATYPLFLRALTR
jgi:hypothetical protein